MSDIEATGADFSMERFLEMRDRTRQAVHAIAAKIEPGMVEEDVRAMARDLLATMDMRRGWHPVITRLGRNTCRDFLDRSEVGVTLSADDIFFVDIGPIHDGYEGDAGETFVVGDDPEHHRARADVRAIWDEVRDLWLTGGCSGRALYEQAGRIAEGRGWRLNLDLAGHRLSDYPHKAAYPGPMADVGLVPGAGLWVLEIAIVHPTREFGAFYEDLLLEDQSLGQSLPLDRDERA